MKYRQHYIRWVEDGKEKYTIIERVYAANVFANSLITKAIGGCAEIEGVCIQRVVWNDHC